MKLHALAFALSIGCSTPKPAPHDPTPPATDATAPTTAPPTTPAHDHDLPKEPTALEPESPPGVPLHGQAKLAHDANEAGKKLLAAHDYAGASARFRDAIARAPEPGFYFNLCTSLYQEGRFGEALSACNAVRKSNTSPALATKTDTLEATIKDAAAHQHIDVKP